MPAPTFLERVLGFQQNLRAAGLPADPAGAIALCTALGHIDLGQAADFHAAARSLLVHRREHLARFDELFREYWYGRRRPLTTAPGEHRTETGGRAPAPRAQAVDRASTGEERSRAGYSPDEVLATKDLAALTEEEIERARELLRAFVEAFVTLRGRRRVPGRHSDMLDFRRMLRRAAAHGGAMPEFRYRRRKLRKTRLLLLCDVSGSMSRYSRFLLEFIYALGRELPQTEAAVFATRMSVITDLLQARSVAHSMREITARAGDWGGGTDIGGCLRDFNDRYARELLRSDSTVVLLSDGWDRGDADLMRAEIARLRRRAARLVWLNPLLGNPNYEPVTRGMRTALPYLDHFLPAHNLQSLARLARVLQADMNDLIPSSAIFSRFLFPASD